MWFGSGTLNMIPSAGVKAWNLSLGTGRVICRKAVNHGKLTFILRRKTGYFKVLKTPRTVTNHTGKRNTGLLTDQVRYTLFWIRAIYFVMITVKLLKWWGR